MEPELECFDAQTRKAAGFGELKGGFVVKCSLKMCREYAKSLKLFFAYVPYSLSVFWMRIIFSYPYLVANSHSTQLSV